MKIRSIPRNHLRFVGVHNAAHANVEGGTSRQAHEILAVRKKVPVSVLSWSSKKIKRVLRRSLAAETSSVATCMGQLDWRRILRSQMTTAGFSLDNNEVCFDKAISVGGDRLQGSVRRDSQGRSRSFVNGQATGDGACHCHVTRYVRRSRPREDRCKVPDCRLSHQSRIEKV